MPEGQDLVLVVAAAATGAVWLLAAGVLFLTRRPPQPPVGPMTLDLGPESPAVANFLVNRLRVEEEAVPATLLDLAARNLVDIEQRGPGVFYVRLRTEPDVSLAPYELRLLRHLHAKASGGVVPAAALTTGPQTVSARWRRAFADEVVADAQSRGLSRDALGGRAFTVLTAASLVPAALVWAASELSPGFVTFGGAAVILGWIRARHPQRETPAGLEATSRWLGVREELRANEVFPSHSPLTVEIWDRLLAYGAALGVAGGSIGPLPMGVESDTLAWSAHDGRWRPVRVSYPRRWPVGWGLEPALAVLYGVGAVVGGALALYFLGPALFDTVASGGPGLVALPFLLIPCAAVVLGVALAAMAAIDMQTTIEVTGPVLRLRAFGDEDRRYYLAVDDGVSDAVRAWRVRPDQYLGLLQGDVVTVSVSRNLGRVRWIVGPDTPA